MLWGALDWQHGTDHPYTSAQTHSSPTIDTAGGVGVRRAELVVDRSSAHASLDVAVCHFDWLNFTSGAPDDTWTTGDYTALETILETFWTALTGYMPAGFRLTQINWYRVGAGAPVPNPAERALTLTSPIAGSNVWAQAPQVAVSLTQRNAVRRSWGRTYLPLCGAGITTSGSLFSTLVDAIANAAQTMVNSGASSDYQLGTYSKHLSAFLATEHVEVDDVWDIQRKRRVKSATYKKILP
jgi:hypothetical protein